MSSSIALGTADGHELCCYELSTMEDEARYILTIGVFAVGLVMLWYKRRSNFGGAMLATRVWIGDTALRCIVCQHDTFEKREGLLNTTWLSAARAGAFNRSGHCLVCRGCSHIHWFAPEGHQHAPRYEPIDS